MEILFGDFLNNMLTVRKICKKDFADTLGINRSKLYRYLSEEQLPDTHLFEHMKLYLNLNETEAKHFHAAYECSRLGLNVYNQIKLVHEILMSLMHHQNQMIYQPISFQHSQNTIALDENDLLNHLTHLLYNELDTTKHIQMILPANNDALNAFTHTLLHLISKDKLSTTVEHIIPFMSAFSDMDKISNLIQIKNLLPFVQHNEYYHTYYSVQDTKELSTHRFFPYFISFDNRFALLISSDLDHALIFSPSQIAQISHMNVEFKKIKADALPLFQSFNDLADVSKCMADYESEFSSSTFCIQPEPSFTTFPESLITKKLLEHHESLNWADILVKRHRLFRKRLRKKHCCQVISLSGLERFLNTGRLMVAGNIIFSIDERLKILHNIIHMLETYTHFDLYLMKESHPLSSFNASVYTIGNRLLYIIPHFQYFNTNDNAIIQERRLIESFNTYFQWTFTEENTIFSKEKVISYINEQIVYLEKKAH